MLQVKNTKALLSDLKLKILLYALPGWGKTDWASRALNPGFIVSDDGHGSGLLTVAERGIDYVEPQNDVELEAAVSGNIFKDKDTLVLDSASHAAMTHIKDRVLSAPRNQGDSVRRFSGVPELDDYGAIGEYTRRILRRLLEQPKHVIVTATLRIKEPKKDQPGPTIVGPDLAGALMLGSSAMFDLVLCGMTRQRLLKAGDAKSRVTERYLLTDSIGVYTAKSRLELAGGNILPTELPVNRETGEGGFLDILARVTAAYAAVK